MTLQFTALIDFWSDETQSQYAEGLSYTANTDRLQELVAEWAKEGKIQLSAPIARVEGSQ